jgi:hypothetical protein
LATVPLSNDIGKIINLQLAVSRNIMTTPKKDKLNWFYIALGLFFGLGFLWADKKDLEASELETKTIVVSQDIQKIGGRSNYEYRLWTKEYACSFVIKTAGGIAAQWDNLDNITKNDTLIIKIHHSRLADLNNKSEDIPIYSLVKNSKWVYDIDSYNKSQKNYDKRWNVIFILMSILFVLRGMTIISNKTAYILVGISAAIIITLRILNLWW